MNASKLTKRQREVVRLIAEGHQVKEIGPKLGVTPKTVEYHFAKARHAIGVDCIALVTQWALKHRIAKFVVSALACLAFAAVVSGKTLPPMPGTALARSPKHTEQIASLGRPMARAAAAVVMPARVARVAWDCAEPDSLLAQYLQAVVEAGPTPAGPWSQVATAPYGPGEVRVSAGQAQQFFRVGWQWITQ